ncbi:hypothetical protein J4E91_007668 [Alternaria rosae]|nr:hypothetical protein J4E91_007668 [Alternaria rosae]
MPEIIVEEGSAGVRSSAPNAINAAFKKSKAAHQPFYTTGFKNLLGQAYESESEEEKPIVGKTAPKISFGDIMAQASGNQDIKSGMPANAPNPINLSRTQIDSRDDYQCRPEYTLIERQPLGVKDRNQCSDPLYDQPKRGNYSSVPLCDHQELFLDWTLDDLDNRKGTWILNIQKYDDISPWSEHHRCGGVHVPNMADAMAIKMIKKFIRLENERLSDRDIADGKAPRRTPAKQRLTRELCNMYNQIQRTKDDKPVDKRETPRESLDPAELRKELAEETLLGAQKSIQSEGAAKPANEDNSRGGSDPSSHSRKSKTPKQIAEEKVARSRKRKGLSDIVRIPSEPLNRFKPSTADERDIRVPDVIEHVRRQRAAETDENVSAPKPSRKSKKFAVATEADEDGATILPPRATKKTKKTIQPPLPLLSDSEDENSEEEVVTKRKSGRKSKLQHMSKAEQASLKGITQAEQEEREQYAENDFEPKLTQKEKDAVFEAEIEAIARAQDAAQQQKTIQAENAAAFKSTGKRKATSGLDDIEADTSSAVLGTSRPIKKAKQSNFYKEAVPTVEQRREINGRLGTGVEYTQHLEVFGKGHGSHITDEDIAMTDEEDGCTLAVEHTEEKEDDGLDYLFEE